MPGSAAINARNSALLLLLLASAVVALAADKPLREGTQFQLAGKSATVTKVHTLPHIESEYTGLFKFDSADNPKLKELRQRYDLDAVVAPGKDEFEKQILLLDWVHNRFKKFGQPSTATRGALDILSGIEAGHTFFCTQYAQLLASTAASLGWVDRVLALRRHQDAGNTGSTEHSTTEIWSNQHRKWVMLDPTSNMFLERNGVPLNAYEIRHEWFYNAGRDLVFVIGKQQHKYRKADLPIYLKRFAGFGDLTIDPQELDKYGFIGYIPNTDLMDNGFDYGQMFIVKDQLCDGTQWHKRKLPKNPATDPYFPIGQASVELLPEKESITVQLKTFTPNFKHFEVKQNDRKWEPTGDTFTWILKPGSNRLQARTVNGFDVAGPVSDVRLDLKD